MKTNMGFMFLILSTSFLLTACSVGSTKYPLSGAGAPLPTEPIANQPGEPDEPSTPAEPVVIGSPISAVDSDTTDSSETSPMPATEVTPVPISEIEATPSTPPATVVDVTDVVEVTTPSIGNESTPLVDNTREPSDTQDSSGPVTHDPATDVTTPIINEPVPTPIVEIVDAITNPSPETEDLNPSTGLDSADDQDPEKETDVVVDGLCLGKKKAGVVWYDKRDPDNKKSKSVKCHNGKFSIGFKEMKSRLKHIEIQTVFYD